VALRALARGPRQLVPVENNLEVPPKTKVFMEIGLILFRVIWDTPLILTALLRSGLQ
jgi:hypothetical protein